MRRGFLAAAALLAACGGADAARPDAPSTTAAGARLSGPNQAALAALAAGGPAALDPTHLDHDVAGHDLWGPVPEVSLSPADAATFDAQWAAATAAAAGLEAPDDAVAAGYQQAAAELPGIGAHYVRWDLVDAPFDPARPSMLLYDESPDRTSHLAGFSYWLRSATAPEGFAGPNDHWHMHHGLCFVDGLLTAEDVVDPAACAGEWLAGTDLWMGHAWVSAAAPNPWGRFAPRNPAVCPADGEATADFNRCPDPLPAAAAHDDPALLDANSLWCAIPGVPRAA